MNNKLISYLFLSFMSIASDLSAHPFFDVDIYNAPRFDLSILFKKKKIIIVFQ